MESMNFATTALNAAVAIVGTTHFLWSLFH